MNDQRLTTRIELHIERPRPSGTLWIDDLMALSSENALRDQMLARFPALNAGRPAEIAIVGMAGEGRRLTKLASELGIRVSRLVDDDKRMHGETVEDLTVGGMDSLDALDRSVTIVVASHRPLNSISRIRAKGFDSVILFSTLQVLFPDMFPPHMFYQDWIPELYRGRGALGRLSEQLGDDVSRSNLDAIVGFRMTKDVGALAPVVDWNVYYPEGIVKLTGDEVYVDAGAYDGDSVKVFVSRCGGHFNSVYAFEPDPNTAERLKKNFQSDKRVTAVPKGLFDRSGALKFHDDGSRGARISEDGTHEIPVVSLDEFLSGKRVTFIKMNIEGAELAALEGAKTAIAAWKPRLAISAYHRPSDLWQIPALMKKLNDKYVLALRQHDLGVIETVAYAF